MKIMISVFLIFGSFAISMSAFADEHCSLTWKSKGRIYADAGQGADIEVFVPAHASQSALSFSRNKNSMPVCLIGSSVAAGSKFIFIASDVAKNL